jgi:hypothetical protein
VENAITKKAANKTGSGFINHSILKNAQIVIVIIMTDG